MPATLPIGRFLISFQPLNGPVQRLQTNEQFVLAVLAQLIRLARGQGVQECRSMPSPEAIRLCEQSVQRFTMGNPSMQWDQRVAAVVLGVAQTRKEVADNPARASTPLALLQPAREAERLATIQSELGSRTWGPESLRLLMGTVTGSDPDRLSVQASIPWGREVPLTIAPMLLTPAS